MDAKLIQELIAAIAFSSVLMLGVASVRAMIWGLGVQGLALGLLLGLRGVGDANLAEELLGASIILVKGIAIPSYLLWSTKRLGVRRDHGAWLGPTLTMLAGALILVFCHFESERFSIHEDPLGIAGLSLATLLVGLLIMVTRRLAISMLIGFLVVDNGIFAYAFSQAPGMPVIVELGMLFDLFVSVLLAGLVLFRVKTSFEHLDVSRMRELHE